MTDEQFPIQPHVYVEIGRRASQIAIEADDGMNTGPLCFEQDCPVARVQPEPENQFGKSNGVMIRAR